MAQQTGTRAGAPLLSANTLAVMRNREAANLPHVCDILTGTRTRGAGGVAETVYAAASATDEGVRCRLMRATSPDEVAIGGAPHTALRLVVAFAWDRSVTAGQRLEVTHDLPGLESPLEVAVIGPVVAPYRASARFVVEVV